MVHEGYSWFKKTTKTTPVSAVLPLSDLLFLLRGQLQGSVSVRSINQWHHYTSVHLADLAILNHLWVFEIVSGLNGIIMMANPLKCLDEWTIGTIKACAHSKNDVWLRNSFRWISKVKSSDMNNISLHFIKHTFFYRTGKNKVWLCWVWQRSRNCRIQYSNTQQQFLRNLNFIMYNYYELTYKLQNI